MPPDVEVCLYRIVQEALTNVARHSGALSCAVSLRRIDDQVELVVEDSGPGDGRRVRRGGCAARPRPDGHARARPVAGGPLQHRQPSRRRHAGRGHAAPARRPRDEEGRLMGRVRILLADDHTVVRQGLRKLLEERPDWEVIAEAGDGREAVRLAEQQKPDVAILDVAMPLLNGIEATRQITKRVPSTRVLVLSMHADEAYVTQILQAGATGYLLKDSADVDLLKAVGEAAQGRSFFSPAIARVMLDDYVRQLADKGVTDRYESLSEREREIFQLIAEAKTNKEIAALLNVSPSTVETHRAHIMEKLDLHSAAEIVLYAVRRGVIR